MNRSTRSRCPQGATLIELVVLALVLGGVILGARLGLREGAAHGAPGRILGGLVGALGGGVTVLVGLVALMVPFEFVRLVRRVAQPFRSACVCGRGAASDTQEVVGRFSGALPVLAHAPEGLDPRRSSLAQALSGARGGPSPEPLPPPVVRYRSYARVPAELAMALRSGLPPRLVFGWACTCAGRALPVQEAEFHEERSSRNVFEAACAALDDPGAATLARLDACEPFFPFRYSGCRVVERPLWARVSGRATRGEHAAEALQRLRQLARAWCEPSALWLTHQERSMADNYDSVEARLDQVQPACLAEALSASAARAAADPAAEVDWQRDLLARLVLGWPSWDADCAGWRARVVDEWVPRVRNELRRARFDIPAYLQRLPAELAPWPGAGPDRSR